MPESATRPARLFVSPTHDRQRHFVNPPRRKALREWLSKLACGGWVGRPPTIRPSGVPPHHDIRSPCGYEEIPATCGAPGLCPKIHTHFSLAGKKALSNALFNGYGTVIAPNASTAPPQIQNQPPTGVGTNGATFNGKLLANGFTNAAVYVVWGQTNGVWTTTNWWASGAWTDGSSPATNLTLAANANYYYTFGATNSLTNVVASGYQYLITGAVTVQPTDPTGRVTLADTAAFTVYRPASCTNEAITVAYTLGGTANSGTHYTNSPAASGTNGTVTILAGQTNAVITVYPRSGAAPQQTVVLSLASGPYAIGSANVATCTLAAVDLTLTANAWLNGNGQLTNATQGVLATATSGTGTQADPYVFGVANMNLGSYTILGNTANNDDQWSATWRVAGNVTGTGNFDSYTTANSTYGGHVRIEAGGTIALNRVYTRANLDRNAGSVYLWANGTVAIATFIDTRTGGSGAAGPVTIRSEGPVSGQGITISGSANGYDGNPYSILTENAANGGNPSASDVSLYCQTNITMAAGISTRGAGWYFIAGAVLIRGDITDGTARAGTVSIGGSGGIRTDTGKTGGNVTIRANALQLTGGIWTTAYCLGTRTGNVDIDVLENATIGGAIDTRMLDRSGDSSQGSPGYVKIVARRIAVLGVDGSGYSIRTWPGTLSGQASSASAAGDADVTLTGVGTSGEIYDPANPITSPTSSIRVAGKIETGRWFHNNAMGNIQVTAVEVQLGDSVNYASAGASPTLAIHYGETTHGVVTHLRENGVYWNGSPSPGHNISYTTGSGAYTYTADVSYAGKIWSAVPGRIENRTEAAVKQTGATFRGRLLEDGDPAVTVSVRWANTEAALTGIYSSYAWTAGAWGDNTLPEFSGASLTPSRDCYYTFVAENTGGTILATPAQYLITGELTPSSAGDPTCGATVGDTATITISRPSTCKAGPLTVNYALSGAGTSYVSASPASGFTLAAGVESQTITFTPLLPNMGAPLPVTLTMLAGAYPSDGLDSAAITVATAVGSSLTASSDTSIGTAMNVDENPPDTVAASLAGSTYTYEFWASSLNLNGTKISYAGTRNLVLQNLAALTDSGAGWIDTSTAASFVVGGGVSVQAAGGIALHGANGSGCAIDTSASQSANGGEVTLMSAGGVSLTAGGIRTQGKNGGRIWITDGAGGSAGNVTIAGDLNAYSSDDNRGTDGSVQVRGNAVSVTGNVLTGTASVYGNGKPITLIASGPLSVGGYLAADQSFTGNGGSGGAVTLSGATVTVSGSLSGLSINTSAKSDYGGNVGGDIQVTATAGDLTLVGGVDASHPSGASRSGAVALSAPSGNISVGSLDYNRFKSISLQAGGQIIVKGALANFPVSEPLKRITFPNGSAIGNHIYYTGSNGAGLSGIYAIYVNGADTGKKLRPGSWNPASQLAFVTQPSASTVAGVAFAQQPVVQFLDVDGYPVVGGADATRVVTVALLTGSGTLSGTLTATAVAGVADFALNGLKINLVGADKVLRFTTTGGVITSADSAAFAITPAAASQLVITTPPSATTLAGVAFAQQPVVKIEDPFGNVVDSGADATREVTVALRTGSGTLSGTLTATAVAGVADFTLNGLKINLVGADKVLRFTTTGGVITSADSAAFAITHAAASRLVFTTQPSSGTMAGVAFAQQPVVKIEDAYGNVVTTGDDATKNVALTLTPGTGTLGGTTAMNAVGGVADFVGKGLNIDLPGVDKVLTATATLTGPVVVTATTSPFTVSVPQQTVIRFQ